MVNETQFYCDIEEVTIYYKRVYFNAIDTIVACMQDQFNQTTFRASQNIEQLLLNTVNNKKYEEELNNVLAVYGDDLNITTIDEHSIEDITKTLKKFSVNFGECFSQVIIVLKILLVMPATTAVSERSISNLRRNKDWLRTSMTQKRLNHCITLRKWQTLRKIII